MFTVESLGKLQGIMGFTCLGERDEKDFSSCDGGSSMTCYCCVVVELTQTLIKMSVVILGSLQDVIRHEHNILTRVVTPKKAELCLICCICIYL